jgi:TRAP-type transport system periplasmic protein
MKRNGFAKLLIVSFTIFTFLLLSAPLSAQDKVIRLKYANYWPTAHQHCALSDQWVKEIEKRTNGRVKITHFSGGTIAPPQQTYDAAVKGIADFSQTLFAYTTGRQPMMELIDYPLGYTSAAQATGLITAYYEKFKPKELDDVKVMYLHAHGPGFIQTRKQISKMEDIKGLRIKCTGINAKIVQAYGGVPVTMPITETYDALQKGLADGVLLPLEVLKNWKFGEMIHCSIRNYGSGYTVGHFVVANKKSWAGLPPDLQKIIEQVNSEWPAKHGKVWDDIDKEALEYYQKAKGHTVVEVSKEEIEKTREKMKPIINEWVQAKKAMGLPAEEAVKFCLDWLKAHP